jgi:hypothetical protein
LSPSFDCVLLFSTLFGLLGNWSRVIWFWILAQFLKQFVAWLHPLLVHTRLQQWGAFELMLECLIMGWLTPTHHQMVPIKVLYLIFHETIESQVFVTTHPWSSLQILWLVFLSQLTHDLHFKSYGWCFCHNSPMIFTSNPMVGVLSQLTHDLHFKSNCWCFITTHPWSSLQIQWLVYLFDLSVFKISKFFLIRVLGKLKRCQEAPSTLGLRSGHNIPPPHMPCNLLMFRFMITFSLCFMVGKAHRWRVS